MDLRTVRIVSTALDGVAFEVRRLEGTEELNRLFRFDVQLTILGPTAPEGLADELLQGPVSLVFKEGAAVVTRVHGLVAELSCATSADLEGTSVCLTVVPRAWAMSQTRRSEIFLDQSVPEILAQKLCGIGLVEGTDFVVALHGKYRPREFVAQYDESDFDFFCRLCEHLGITFFFDHSEGRDVLVLSDTADAFRPIDRPGALVPFRPKDERHAAFEVTSTVRRVPAEVAVHDHNYRLPRLPIEAGRAVQGKACYGAQVEYGVHAKTPEEAKQIARVRAEELSATHRVVSGRSWVLSLRAGATFVLVDVEGEGQALLVTKVIVRSHLPGEANGGVAEQSWHNEFTAIPAELPYRPPRRTRKPKVPGLVHAVVDGAVKGPYAELDDAGRYRLRFRYDRSGRGDLLATHAVRMLQPHAGAHYGLHFPLRPGIEVLVDFIEGDPDRPVIVGCAPNPETPSPVALRNGTQNVLRTASGNELVIEDAVGEERVRLHSPKHNTTLQMGSMDEREDGALLKTNAHLTLVAGRSLDAVMDRGTSLMNAFTSLVAGNAVTLAGIEDQTALVDRARYDFAWLRERAGAVAQELAQLVPEAGEREVPPEVERRLAAQGGGRPPMSSASRVTTFSGLGERMNVRAHEVAADSVGAIAAGADGDSSASEPRTRGETACPASDPRLVLGSRSNATLFSRATTLVHAERTASLSSTDTARIVGSRKVDVCSPEEVEITGRRSVRVTSSNLFDLRADRMSVLAGPTPDDADEALPPEVSAAVVAAQGLRLKSLTGPVVACAQTDLTLHAHEGAIQIVAQRSIEASAGAIQGSAADVTIDARQRVHIRAGGAELTMEGGEVTIKATKIRLLGETSVEGPLSVSGGIRGALLGGG